MDIKRNFIMNLIFPGRRYFSLFFSVLLISVSTGYCNPEKHRSGNHPAIILKEEKVLEIRELAKQDELLQDIIDEIFRMADAELEQPLINYKELIGRPHRTSKEALSGKYVLDIASLSGSRLLLLSTAYRFSQDPSQKHEYKDRILAEINALVALPDWNPGHFLDIGEISFGLAITYDWMYDELSADYRKKIETSLLNKAILPGIAAYRRKAKWTHKFNNHTQVINAGLVIAALALNDIFPEPCRQILALAKQVMPKAMKDFYAPNGVYVEGPSYWQYGTTFNILMIDALKTTLNDDWGLLGTEGFQRTGAFQMHSISPTYKYFNFADAPEKARIPPALFWLSKVYEEPSYSGFMEAWLKRIFEKRDPSSKEASVTLSGTLSNKSISRFFPLAAIWYHKYPHTNKNVPTQIVFKEKGVAIMRSQWNDETALYLGIKGGKNGVSHGHLDLGSFVMENDGVRWAIDFGRELYNLPGISRYYSQNSKRWDYFRLGTRSHNTLLINGENQNVKGRADIVRYDFSDSMSFVELDLSKAYSGSAKSVKRSIAMVDGRHVIIKDEIAARKGDEIRWAMATSAGIEIAGNKATLSSDNKKLYAHVITPEDASFTLISTKPDNPDEKQNEGTRMLGVYTSAQSSITKIVIILTNDPTENLKPLIPMELSAE